MSLDLILSIVLMVIGLLIIFVIICRCYSRRDGLRRAYHHINKARRQSKYPPEMFTRAPEVNMLIRFLREELKVPETVTGFESQSQLSLGDLSRLVTLWAALGEDANLCYGFIDDSRRRPRHSAFGSHASIWVEFSFLGELWVYWYEDDAAVVDYRRSFYHHGATILHDLRFNSAGSCLFKS